LLVLGFVAELELRSSLQFELAVAELEPAVAELEQHNSVELVSAGLALLLLCSLLRCVAAAGAWLSLKSLLQAVEVIHLQLYNLLLSVAEVELGSSVRYDSVVGECLMQSNLLRLGCVVKLHLRSWLWWVSVE
jgi:hypothetical protein